jgi:putative oxidoreductase
MHASIAERMAFGTPLDPAVDDTPIHIVPRSTTALIGRILIAAIFVLSGFAKLTDPAGASGYMTHVGIPNADTLVYVAGVAELLGGLALMFGFLTRLAAAGLILYLIPTTLLFHNFWAMDGAEAKTQMVNFMKNLAIMGGLATLVAFGAPRISISHRVRRSRLR